MRKIEEKEKKYDDLNVKTRQIDSQKVVTRN